MSMYTVSLFQWVYENKIIKYLKVTIKTNNIIVYLTLRKMTHEESQSDKMTHEESQSDKTITNYSRYIQYY